MQRGLTQSLGTKATLRGTYRLMSLNPHDIDIADVEVVFCLTTFRQGFAYLSFSTYKLVMADLVKHKTNLSIASWRCSQRIPPYALAQARLR